MVNSTESLTVLREFGYKTKVVIKNNSKPRRQAPPQQVRQTKKPRLEI